ncbi:MAG: hypothetical protein DWQ31_04460 [Planctomycetota bacterium]|nr:MAG: hypothetical protein DWQ31_04460 [Planctomycetota bacterium]REJ89062.1 MAG: hypothetical protein DWQ35_18805 [Planctomycetota bacterium]REK17482.1 MAG: hypothetical protein DWQ42_22375 [Planctomycetota bacterium]
MPLSEPEFPIGLIVLAIIVTAIVHFFFAAAVYRDAHLLPTPRRPISVWPAIWFLATPLGGLFVAVAYWFMHHSTLNPEAIAGSSEEPSE